MARLTQNERDLIAAARARGAHPEAPIVPPAATPAPAAGLPHLHELSPAQLRAVAEAERARIVAQGVGAVLRWAGARLGAATRGLRRMRLERRTRAELSALSDTMLRDIGIPRGEILQRARENAERAFPPPAKPAR